MSMTPCEERTAAVLTSPTDATSLAQVCFALARSLRDLSLKSLTIVKHSLYTS